MAAKMALGRSFIRKYSSHAGEPFDVYAHSKGADKTKELWKKLGIFVGLPAVALGLVNAYLIEKEHEETVKRPEFKRYDHMRIRTKNFPWGDGQHSLFHNPHRNALPDGYETEEEHHH